MTHAHTHTRAHTHTHTHAHTHTNTNTHTHTHIHAYTLAAIHESCAVLQHVQFQTDDSDSQTLGDAAAR